MRVIGSDGEKYSPEGIEEALVEKSSCIDQLMLHNNQNAYTVALVVPNKERLKTKLARMHLDLSSDKGKEAAIQIIQEQINRFKTGGIHAAMFPDRWLPTTFAILPEPFTEQNQMINSTMKMVRGKIEKAYMPNVLNSCIRRSGRIRSTPLIRIVYRLRHNRVGGKQK